MLDSGWHQGSSLLGQSSGQLRVLSVIPSGEVEDLHALWQACAALQAQGYPVMILDGLESETDQAPGLEDVLQGCSSTALPAHLTQSHAIASLPAARGLQELADWAQASGQPPLGQLYRHFRNHALLVVLAPAPLLGAVCKGVQQAPWLLVPSPSVGKSASRKMSCCRKLYRANRRVSLLATRSVRRSNLCVSSWPGRCHA